MEAVDKGYLGIEMFEDYTYKQVPTKIQEQQKYLSVALSKFPEYSDIESSRGFVELLSELDHFKHMNMDTLAAAIIFYKRHGFDLKDPNDHKFGNLMLIYNFPWVDKGEKGNTCSICRKDSHTQKTSKWCTECLSLFTAYKLDIIRYLRMLKNNEDIFTN